MISKILKPSNWKKTYYYLKKNGFRAAVMAALERLQKSENDSYQYVPPTQDELERQREISLDGDVLFSILVPVYRTPEKYFREMIQSVLDQSYPHWELLLGDASPEEHLKFIVEEINDKRVKYIKIPENKGISANTNVILKEASGAYIGLLDHDDVLTPDALFCMYEAIQEGQRKPMQYKMEEASYEKPIRTVTAESYRVRLLYSDEDKSDGEMHHFYDVNTKPALDQDYLWSNNYICHFTVMEAELMKRLGFRSAFDGAQDYDIILRAVREISKEQKINNRNSQVRNISKVLYHWRCHTDSTAVNPQSKLYAYEAGKRAVEEDLQERGIEAVVHHSRHLGFYQVNYVDLFRDRPEVAMVAGPIYRRGRVAGGARNEAGVLLYGGLRKGFSGGHLHRAGVWQQCYAADFGHAVVRRDLFLNFLKSQGLTCMKDSGVKNVSYETEAVMHPQELLKHLTEEQRDRLCVAWANYVHAGHMVILYNPEME